MNPHECPTCDGNPNNPPGWLYVKGKGWTLCPECTPENVKEPK